jgi:hypothetical protein
MFEINQRVVCIKEGPLVSCLLSNFIIVRDSIFLLDKYPILNQIYTINKILTLSNINEILLTFKEIDSPSNFGFYSFEFKPITKNQDFNLL